MEASALKELDQLADGRNRPMTQTATEQPCHVAPNFVCPAITPYTSSSALRFDHETAAETVLDSFL